MTSPPERSDQPGAGGHADAESRLLNEIETGRTGEILDFFVQHLAVYGAGNLDVGQLARRIYQRIEDED